MFVNECFAAYRIVPEQSVKFAEEPGILLQNRIKVDRYYVLRGDIV